MMITARQPVETTVVAVSAAGNLRAPEPSAVFALFPEATAGATFFDDPALGVRVFTLPQQKIRLTFERMRMRVEDTASRRVEDLTLGELAYDLAQKLYPAGVFDRYGFNYDMVYRYDQMLPSHEIIGIFLKKEILEDVSHFGWQCTITKDKGKRRETYFFKVLSPLELQILANIEFDKHVPDRAALQQELLRFHAESQKILDNLTLTSRP